MLGSAALSLTSSLSDGAHDLAHKMIGRREVDRGAGRRRSDMLSRQFLRFDRVSHEVIWSMIARFEFASGRRASVEAPSSRRQAFRGGSDHRSSCALAALIHFSIAALCRRPWSGSCRQWRLRAQRRVGERLRRVVPAAGARSATSTVSSGAGRRSGARRAVRRHALRRYVSRQLLHPEAARHLRARAGAQGRSRSAGSSRSSSSISARPRATTRSAWRCAPPTRG